MALASIIALSSMWLATAAPAVSHGLRPWSNSTSPDGAAHFAQFQTACLETGGRLSAVAARAESEHWTTVEQKKAMPNGFSGNAWHYAVGDRAYDVLVLEWTWTYSNKPDLKGLPIRQCSVATRAAADDGALGEVMKHFDSPGCGTTDLATYAGVQWRKRGNGYLVTYDFVRDLRDKAKPQDGLIAKTVGADQTFASLDLNKMC